jgi:Na+/H+-translocating membrane pyrophosphatase
LIIKQQPKKKNQILLPIMIYCHKYFNVSWNINASKIGDGKMKEISDYIYEGALAFLKANIDY